MIPTAAGEIHFEGQRVDNRSTHEFVRQGVAHCMEGRRIFGDLMYVGEAKGVAA